MHPFFQDLGAQFPLIQSPMAGAQDESLGIAVARAGAVGSIPCAALTAQDARRSALRFQKATAGPLNLNFFCHTVPARDPTRDARWLHELRGYYADLSLPADYPKNAHLRPFDADMVDVVCDVKPAVVSFHFGLPDAVYIDRIRATGAKIIATATTLKEAELLAQNGCDAVIAQGKEAGGHQGVFLPTDAQNPLNTIDLVARIAGALTTPVIAAGGIADQAGIRAALAAGASGVQIGTRFLKSPEATITPLYRRILDGAEPRDTQITNVFTGRPARAFVTRLVRDLGPMNPNVQAFPYAASALGPLRGATAGADDFAAMWAGQNWKTGTTKPARDIVLDLAQAFDPVGVEDTKY
ncbi:MULTISPECIES: nitronate monooxygenase family protein [Roseobacteraceae]|uniref:NAD(P)H-dependent flavin oxidoreductase n=1 Tax=Roseobacteraceae TaxID=2854170 RepID=UPI003299365E